MAEDNTGFSPLDPLGPEYGKINQPSLDQRGLSPFEGDRINQKPINFPEPKAFPIMPGVNLNKPQRNVRETVVGSPGNPVNKNATVQDRVNATRDYLSAKIKAGQSKDSFAKIYSYDAGPDSNAFYKRYQAYGQEKFDQIGFSPLRDNEALFNSRTTVMDDYNRMLTHSFVPLFTRGFVSGPKSLMKMLQGDFTSSDLEDARAYEEAAAIGQSSKGGFSGFLNNSLMNFGYTAGIISEAVLEEVGGALLAAPTGGASLFATTANNLRKIKGLGAMTDVMKGVGSTLKNLNNLQFTRNFWNASKSVTASKIGRFFNPLENTFDAIGDLRKLSKTDNITGLAATYKTAGGFYRDVRNLNMAISEARLEAGMVENKRYDEDYRKLYELNKRAPTNEEQKMLEKNAKDAASDTFYWNAGLIYATNKITFDNITGPRGGLRNFIKNTIDDVYTIGGGKFGNIGKIVYNNASKAFEFEANNLKQLAKSWWKQPGLKTFGKTVGYLKANLSEGIQENFQEVIARTNEKYYAQTFDSKLRQSHEYGKAVGQYSFDSQSKIFKEELGKEFTSAQGFETFASGFFMGVFAHPLNASVPFLSTNYNRIFKKEEFAKYKAEKEKIKTELVNKLNSIDIKDFVKSKAFNLGIQDVLANVRQTGSKKEAIDAELEGMVESVQTMLSTNTLDLFVDNLKNISQMDDAEFIDSIKDISEAEVPKYRERVAQTITKLNRIQDRFNYYKDKMPNPISDERLSGLKGQDLIDAATLKAGWDLSIKNAVFYNEAFEDTMSRMKGIYDKFMNNTTLKKFGQTELGLLFDQDKLSNEISYQRKEIKSIEDLAEKTPEAKAELKKKKEYLKNLEGVRDSYTAFDEFYNRQDYYELVRESLKEELGRDATNEEVLAKAESIVGKDNDEKRQTKVVGNLQKSVYNYIRHVANVNKDFVFDDNLDKGFELLLDHYKLGQEGRMLVDYINLLHNPGSFFEAAQRNQQWMKDMYNRRSEYYENLVKKQMDEVENNALLNALADQGIFINLEDLQNWLDNGVPPKEFFNNVTKEVIPQGSQEYLTAMLVLQQKKELQESEKLSDEEIMNAIGKGITNAGEARISYSDSQIKELVTKLENDEEGNLILPGKAFKDVFGPTLKNKRAIALSNSVNQELLRLVNKEAVVEETPVETPTTNKKAAIERETDETVESYVNRLFDNNYFVEVDGKQIFSLTQGRWGIIVNVNGIKIPFYQSTSGTDTKIVGQWYPFFGDQGNWVIKGNSDDSNIGYGFKAIQDVQSFLNKNIKEKDAIARSGLISSDVLQNQDTLRRLDESKIKGNDNLSINKEATAKRLSKLMGYTIEAANKTKSDAELFKLASKKVFAELAALEAPVSDKKADIEKELFSETDSKGRILTVFSTTKEKDGLITTKFIFNRSDKDPSQRNSMITGIPIEKGLGNKYTINEEYLPEGAKVVGVSEIRQSKAGAAATVTFEVDGERYQGEVQLNSNTTYDAELAALEGTKPKTVPISEVELVTPQSINEVEEALKAVYQKNLAVNLEDSNTYIEVDENGVRIPGTPLYDRVSVLKGEFTGPKNAANRGTIIDDLLREFIDGSISTIEDLKKSYDRNTLKDKAPKFSDGFLEELYAIFSEVKSVTEQNGLQLTSRIPTLWGKINGKNIAGTIDVLAIDPKGNVYIIDLKTSTRNRRDVNDQYYKTYRDNDSIQQSAYAELIRQRTGITVKNIVIFPVQILANKQGTLVSAVANKEGDKFTMAVQIDRDIFPEVVGAVPEDEAGIVVGTDLSDAAKAKLEKLGFIKDMINVMSKEEIELAKTLQPETASELRDQVIQRLRDQGIYVPYITRFTLKKDQNLISEMNLVITDEKGEQTIFASAGDTVVVNSINVKEGTAVLQKAGSKIKGSFTIADMDKMFKLEDMGTKSEPVDIENKDEATSFTGTGNDVTDAFIENMASRTAIENAVEENYDPNNPNSIVDQAEEDLLNDTDC